MHDQEPRRFSRRSLLKLGIALEIASFAKQIALTGNSVAPHRRNNPPIDFRSAANFSPSPLAPIRGEAPPLTAEEKLISKQVKLFFDTTHRFTGKSLLSGGEHIEALQGKPRHENGVDIYDSFGEFGPDKLFTFRIQAMYKDDALINFSMSTRDIVGHGQHIPEFRSHFTQTPEGLKIPYEELPEILPMVFDIPTDIPYRPQSGPFTAILASGFSLEDGASLTLLIDADGNAGLFVDFSDPKPPQAPKPQGHWD